MSYQGWSNYETWVTKLWIDNEQGIYSDVTSEAASEPDAYKLADWLQRYVDDLLEGQAPESGLAADLFRSAFQEIDWREMAESYLEDFTSED